MIARSYTAEQREAVLDRWARGRETMKQIGAAVGLREHIVNSILDIARRRETFDPRAVIRGRGSDVSRPAPYTAAQRDAVLDAWLAGEGTEREIAQAFGLKRSNVASILDWARRNQDPRAVSRARGKAPGGVPRLIEKPTDFDLDAGRAEDAIAEGSDAHLADLIRVHGAPERCPSLRQVVRAEARLALPRHVSVAMSGIGSPAGQCVEG